MGKFVSPLLGYNNNVRHKNRVFHIQTEDSGASRPHIITHLFMDGGRILKSVKTSYAEHVGTDSMTETVRQMMKDQHKAMFVALREGQFDHLLDGKHHSPRSLEPPPTSPTVHAPGPRTTAQETVQPPSAFAVPPPATSTETARPLPPRESPTVMPTPVATATMLAPPVATPKATMAAPPNDTAPPPNPTPTALPPREAGTPAFTATPLDDPPRSRASESARDLTMDFDALGGPAQPSSPWATEATTTRAATPPPRAVAPSVSPPQANPFPGVASMRPPTDTGRYTSVRPAAIFGPPSQRPAKSIFSDELLSDKSLDEVILGFLAEDVDPSSRK